MAEHVKISLILGVKVGKNGKSTCIFRDLHYQSKIGILSNQPILILTKGQLVMNSTKAQRIFLSSSLSVFLAGCGAPNYSQSEMHMTFEEAETTKQVKPERIPALVKASPTAPVLADTEDSSTFDVVVNNVPVRDLLFALARDAGINMDIDDEVGGYVSISALDQTLDAILARIGEQIAIRVTRVGDAIVIKADTHYYKYYQVDFLNVSRTYSSSATAGGVGNTGSSSVSNTASNNFWGELEASINQILGVNYSGGESGAVVDQQLKGSEGAAQISGSEFKEGAAGNSYNLNQDTGVLTVYAPDRLQKEIQVLLDRNMTIAKRQVLLEATIVEVVLNNQYAQGIDWSLFNSLAEEGLALYQGGGAGGAAAALEYLTREITRNANAEFNAASLVGLTAADIINSYGLSGSTAQTVRTVVGNAEIQGPAQEGQQPDAAEVAKANRVASILRNANDANFLAATSSDPFALVRERISNPTQSVPNESGYITYTSQNTYTAEEVNDLATQRSSGGLKPNNTLDGGFFTAAYRQGDISAAVQLLDTFGDAKVLSSPRISALNHQPALLRVVDQEVYFSFTVSEDVNEETGQATSREFSATENTVDVGFSMNVLPYISENGEVILNLKPAVTRILDYRRAPILESFGTAAGGTQNLVPITRVRELESIISLRDGEIAVMGGLLEDRTGDDSSSVPGLSNLPGVGTLFQKKNQSTYKTEFVVFIRARVINNPSVNGDYSDFRHLLPNGDFILRETSDTLWPPAQRPAR